MTPKDKALELVQKYFKANHQPYGFKDAKQCALIAVDEILDMVKHTPIEFIETDYWQEVKQEIENL
jgi:hypothetical protein